MTGEIITSKAEIMGSSVINGFVQFIDRGERTTRNAVNNLRQFVAWARYSEIEAPQRADIINFRDWLLSEHKAVEITASGWEYRQDKNGNPEIIICKPSTVKCYLQTVKQFFSWTASCGIYPNVAENVHAPKLTTVHKKDSLTASEVVQIEESITESSEQRAAAAAESVKDVVGRVQRSTEQGKRLFAMYLLAVNAGLRTVELSRARVRDFETKGSQSWLYIHGKGHAEADQKKPLAPEVAEAIRDYLKSRKDEYTGNSPLFVATGNRSGGKAIAETTISTMLKKALQEAGFDSDRLTAHSLRHTVGGNMMEITGNNVYSTQQYMRHVSPATTEIYLDNDKAAQDAELASRLYNHYHGREEEEKAELLRSMISRMTPEQLNTLYGVAAAIA